MHTDIAELTENAAQLSAQDFDQFLANVYTRRAKSHAVALTSEEQVLLEKIYQKLPSTVLARFEELQKKCLAETLSPAEHREYMVIVETMENHNAARLQMLVQLARIRGVAPKKLMEQLGVFPLHAH